MIKCKFVLGFGYIICLPAHRDKREMKKIHLWENARMLYKFADFGYDMGEFEA